MDYFLFLFYLVIFSWLVSKLRFFKSTGLEKKTIVGIFLIKIAAGCCYGWIHQHYYIQSDSWKFHHEGINEYHLLWSDPAKYLTNLFENNYSEGFSRIMDSADSFWNDLRTNLLTKLLSVFDIFSGCNYYSNVIFFNFLTIFGGLCFYKVFIKIFPENSLLVLAAIFLFPSLLFFTSGIHRDGLVLLGIGLIIYNVFYAFRIDRFSIQRIAGIFGGIVIIFLFRNFVLVTLLPSLVAWLICERRRRFAFPLYLLVFACFILIFFNLGRLNPKLDLPNYVSERQLTYFEYPETTSMELNPLFPNFRSFMNNAPQALNHSLMRPYITELKKSLQLPAALEIIAFEVLFLLFLFFRKKRVKTDPFIFFGVLFTLSMFLLIGYTIPVLGALVRYRSVYFPFILAPLLCYIDWIAIKNYIRLNKS